MCCKNWKNETLIGITKMDFNKALFFVIFWANLVSFVSATISVWKVVNLNSRSAFYRYLSLAVVVGYATRKARL